MNERTAQDVEIMTQPCSTLSYPISPCPTPTTSVGVPTTAPTGADVGQVMPGMLVLLLIGFAALALARRRSR